MSSRIKISKHELVLPHGAATRFLNRGVLIAGALAIIAGGGFIAAAFAINPNSVLGLVNVSVGAGLAATGILGLFLYSVVETRQRRKIRMIFDLQNPSNVLRDKLMNRGAKNKYMNYPYARLFTAIIDYEENKIDYICKVYVFVSESDRDRFWNKVEAEQKNIGQIQASFHQKEPPRVTIN